MSHLRRCMLLSCLALTAGLWIWAWLQPAAHTPLALWPFQAWAALSLAQALMSTQAQGRRATLTTALLLLGSTQALQMWHILMPHADWVAAGMPVKPTLAELPAKLKAALDLFLSLRWVYGFSDVPWPVWLLAAPVCLSTQVINGNHPAMPAWSRVAAKFACFCWIASWLMWLGNLLVGTMPDAPLIFWGLLVVMLPLRRHTIPTWLLLPAWLSSLAGLIVAGLHHVVSPVLARDATLALALLLTTLNWLVWYVRMDAILRFDKVLAGLRELVPDPQENATSSQLDDSPSSAHPASSSFDRTAHLDSPQAQEGADKYTRE